MVYVTKTKLKLQFHTQLNLKANLKLLRQLLVHPKDKSDKKALFTTSNVADMKTNSVQWITLGKQRGI